MAAPQNEEEMDIPDNFLDDVVEKARTGHSRFESRHESLKKDFEQYLDPNVAHNLANNLATYMDNEDKENEANKKLNNETTDQENDQDDNDILDTSTFTPGHEKEPQKLIGGYANEHPDSTSSVELMSYKDNEENTLDEVLISTVNKHSRKESREEFLKGKLGQVFQNDEKQNETDFNPIASTLANFLGGVDDNDNDMKVSDINNLINNNKNNDIEKPEKRRGSEDLSELVLKVSKLEHRIKELESECIDKDKKYKKLEEQNIELSRKVQFLQYAKTELALVSNEQINELRYYLKMYQTYYTQKETK